MAETKKGRVSKNKMWSEAKRKESFKLVTNSSSFFVSYRKNSVHIEIVSLWYILKIDYFNF